MIIFICLLFADMLWSRGSIPEIMILMLGCFCTRKCDINDIALAIFSGVSQPTLLVPQTRIAYFSVSGNFTFNSLHKIFCVWSPGTPKFNVGYFSKYLNHTLWYRLRPLAIESPMMIVSALDALASLTWSLWLSIQPIRKSRGVGDVANDLPYLCDSKKSM